MATGTEVILKRTAIAAQKVQSFLGGSDSVLRNAILDLSAEVKIGDKEVIIPRMGALSLKDITPGTRALGDARDVEGDTLVLSSSKEVSDYLGYITTAESAVDREIQFFKDAPRIYVQGTEALIAAQLVVSGANDFTSSEVAANIPTGIKSFNIKDVAKAKKLLDQQKVPFKDRYMAVNAEGMEILASTQEFQDGSKALSAQALNEGVVSLVKGFKVIQTEDVPAGKVLCFHKEACAYADHKEMTADSYDDKPFAQLYVFLRGKYGSKLLDSGKRKVVITMITGTKV